MSDSISRLNEALEGRYRIERQLGEGGMATVYLAEDLKHERKVAVKVLKPELAAALGAERFLAEIKTTANLQHPNILPLFDSGEADGVVFYTMPFVEGESLRDRLDREKQLPVDEAVRIATDVAEALQAAHEQGVIHRDIKPANILLSRGRPLVADFGIALAVSVAGGDRLTETGLSLGTPHYMSPEQATGEKNIGPAADTYALGCVVYEMLTGEPPYTGSTAQAILGKIITQEPASATEHRQSVPANVDAAIRRALEKLPADRFTDPHGLARAIADPAFRHGELAVRAGGPGVQRWRAVAVAMTVTTVLFGLLAFWPNGVSEMQTVGSPAWYSQPFEDGQEPTTPYGPEPYALSPDGALLVYPRNGELWLRTWSERDAVPIPRTVGAETPAISPQRDLAFERSGEILVLQLPDGPPAPWTEGTRPRWGPDNALYFTAGDNMFRLREAGAVPEQLSEGGGPNFVSHVLPEGGLALTYGGGEMGLLELRSGGITPIGEGSRPRLLGNRHLVFWRDRSLWAASLDRGSGELGPADVVLGGVWGWTTSDDGKLFYATDDFFGPHTPVRVMRNGDWEQIEPGWYTEAEPGGTTVAISPSGQHLAISTWTGQTSELWLKDLETGERDLLTDRAFRVSWTPDGSVLHVSSRENQRAMWAIPADGTGPPIRVLRQEDPRVQQGELSSDGRWLAYRAGSPTLGESADIFALRLGADSVGAPIVAEPESDETDPAISPDGRWLAYTSDRSGQRQVYVSSFPDPSEMGRVVVSPGEGTEPRWARGTNELFYRSGNGLMTAVQYEVTGGLFDITDREALFPANVYLFEVGIHSYDVFPDGQSFLMFRPRSGAPYRRTHVIENWGSMVQERMR